MYIHLYAADVNRLKGIGVNMLTAASKIEDQGALSVSIVLSSTSKKQ